MPYANSSRRGCRRCLPGECVDWLLAQVSRAVFIAEPAKLDLKALVFELGMPFQALALEILDPMSLAGIRVALFELFRKRPAKDRQATILLVEAFEWCRLIGDSVAGQAVPTAVGCLWLWL